MNIEIDKSASKLRRLLLVRPQSWFFTPSSAPSPPPHTEMYSLDNQRPTIPARSHSLYKPAQSHLMDPSNDLPFRVKKLLEREKDMDPLLQKETSIPARRTSRYYVNDPVAQDRLNQVLSSDRMMKLSQQIQRSSRTPAQYCS